MVSRFSCFLGVLLFFAAGNLLAAKRSDLVPVTRAELNLATPLVDPEADVEYLFRRYETDDRRSLWSRFSRTYFRAKVFTDKGVKDLDVIRLLGFRESGRIMSFEARVTNPDGSIVTLDRSDLYEKNNYEDRDVESRLYSFSFPQLQVGSVVEWRWSEVVDTGRNAHSFGRLIQSDFPTHKYSHKIYPSGWDGSNVRGFNYDISIEMVEDNVFLIEASDLEGYAKEEYAPHRFKTAPWFLLRYFRSRFSSDPEVYWIEEAKELWRLTHLQVKPKQSAVRKLAKELFDGIKDEEEALRRAYRFCTEEITNIYDANSGYTKEERRALKSVDSPGETVKRGYGSWLDINHLFASLAAAAGWEVRLAYVEDVSGIPFDPYILARELTLKHQIVALQNGTSGEWRFFDPGGSYLPFEVLHEDHSGATVLLADQQQAYLGKTPLSSEGDNELRRSGQVSLSVEGTLSGEIEYRYSGHDAIRMRRRYDDWSKSEREQRFVDSLKSRLPNAEVSGFQIENLFSRNGGLGLSYEDRGGEVCRGA